MQGKFKLKTNTFANILIDYCLLTCEYIRHKVTLLNLIT